MNRWWRRHLGLGSGALVVVAALLLVAVVRLTGALSSISQSSAEERRGVAARGGAIMVVGDSISQGLEVDYTWRYRLSEHFRAHDVGMTFVGPWVGTYALPPAQPDGYPNVSAPAVHDGAYRRGISFPSANLAQWGWTIRQAKDAVGPAAQRYQPDYLLVELGFNDLLFEATDPVVLKDELHTLIGNVRRARPSIRIILANVIHGEPYGAARGLAARIGDFNATLFAQALGWSTVASPVTLADIDDAYEPAVDSYDGVHPNAAGEVAIAGVFADVLSSRFDVGPRFTAPVVTAGEIRPTAPRSIAAVLVGGRIHVDWPHSFGTEGYYLYSRDLTSGQQFHKGLLPLAADSGTLGGILGGHTYEYKVSAIRGTYESAVSPIAAAVAS